MVAGNRRNMVVERTGDGVWAVRFARPDLSDQLYEDADAEVNPLYQELWCRVLFQLRHGQSVILNFGLVERFSSAFYRCLLKVREVLASRGARLILCRLSPEHEEVFALFKGFDLFRVAQTELRAAHEALTRRDAEAPAVRRQRPRPSENGN